MLNRRGRAINEPNDVIEDSGARHLTRMDDIVEDEEPALRILARLCEEAEIRVDRVGCRVVSDRAVLIDLQLRRRDIPGGTIEHAAVVGAVLCLGRLRG